MARYGKSLNIWVYVVIAVTPLIIVIGVFMSGLVKIAEYNEFIRDLNNSTLFAMKNDSLCAEYNGEYTRVTPKNADLIFQEIVSSGYIFLRENIDDSEYISLDFGNGDKLCLYINNEESLVLQYMQQGKRKKEYLTSKITRLITFEHLISEEWGNSPWEDN